jgi:hypothetical protein
MFGLEALAEFKVVKALQVIGREEFRSVFVHKEIEELACRRALFKDYPCDVQTAQLE